MCVCWTGGQAENCKSLHRKKRTSVETNSANSFAHNSTFHVNNFQWFQFSYGPHSNTWLFSAFQFTHEPLWPSYPTSNLTLSPSHSLIHGSWYPCNVLGWYKKQFWMLEVIIYWLIVYERRFFLFLLLKFPCNDGFFHSIL